MEETSQESKEIKVQYFLPEILEKIFRNLNVQDLSRVAVVNKLWNEVAMHEQSKRGLEITVISITSDNVYSSVTAKPYVTLMFVAPVSNGVKVLQHSVLKKYKDHFPPYLVTIGLHNVIMDKEVILCNHEMSEGGILSLLIPNYRDLNIRTAYTQNLSGVRDFQGFLQDFLPQESKSKATFFIFSQQQYGKELFFASLKGRMEERKQKFSLWGGAFDKAPLAAINGHIDEKIIEECERYYDDWKDYNGVFAMSITGSTLESSSIVISGLIKKQEFDQKLIDFRDQLQLKGRTIGLACGPAEVDDFSGADLSDVYKTFPEMLHAVKTIFPYVPFIGIYDKSCVNRFYGLKSTEDDPGQQLEHRMALALMILTYD